MSRNRFILVVVLLAMAVSAVAFAGGLQLLDDGEPDAPPTDGSTGATSNPSETTSSSPSSTSTATAQAGPMWIVVVASEGSERGATTKADAVADLGQPVGVLRSDDYPSLNPGLWVAYAGPYPDPGAADQASDALQGQGVPGTYVRCAGTAEECHNEDG